MTVYPKTLIVHNSLSGLLAAFAVFVVGFVYGLGHVYRVPDTGFSYNTRWQVIVFSSNCAQYTTDAGVACNTGQDTLYVGDEILTIYGPGLDTRFDYEEYNTNLTATPFQGFDKGDVVKLDIQRGQEKLTIFWSMPPRSNLDQWQRLSTIWVFLPFWLAGTAVILFLRPKDMRWRLLILQNYVTGLWLVFGTVSFSQIFGSTFLLIGLSWLIMPVYLHLHCLIPSPFALKGRWIIPALYVIAGAMALLNMLGFLPLSTYYLALLIGIGGSLVLLALRAVRSALPAEKSVLNLMLLGIGVSLLPGILLWLLPTLVLESYSPDAVVIFLTTLSIPLLSFFYTYALYTHGSVKKG